MSSSSASKCVIVDLDGSIAKVGFAGESQPRFSIPFDLQCLAQDWNHLRFKISAFFQNLFYHKLHVKSRSTQILVIENLFWPKMWRDCIYTVLLYDFQVAAVCFQPSIYMGLLASGVSTGVLVSIQRQELQVLCFAYHRPLLPTLSVAKVGYHDLLNDINAFLSAKSDGEEGKSITAAEKVLAALFADTAEETTEDLTVTDRMNLMECLFSGYSLVGQQGLDDNGLVDLILSALSHCPTELRSVCARSICIVSSHPVISPNATVFTETLLHRLKDGIAVDSPLHGLRSELALSAIRPFLRQDTSALPFLGASLFASIPTNGSRFLTSEMVLPTIPKQLRMVSSTPLPPPSAATGEAVAVLRREDSLDHPEDEHQLVDDPALDRDNSLWRVRLTAPDWLAVHAQQWVFYGPKIAQ